jgi:dihydrodipicolinate synthase/N-acetylneuraminate lyase
VAALYQNGHTLAQSLAAIKGLLHLRGLCSPAVFPPLLPLAPDELEVLRAKAVKLQVLTRPPGEFVARRSRAVKLQCT